MKTLLILRHADALHVSPSGQDSDRPLSPKGHAQTSHLAAWIRDSLLPPPGTVLCSPATRTRQTLEALPPSFASPPAHFLPKLYSAGPHAMFEAIEGSSANTQTVLVVGHNPTVSAVASDLLGSAVPLATCALVVIELDLDDWQLLRGSRATLSYRVRGCHHGMDA